jgi:hypothetical protein
MCQGWRKMAYEDFKTNFSVETLDMSYRKIYKEQISLYLLEA